jgi:NitT/TauT family transport system substrate-binding protein
MNIKSIYKLIALIIVLTMMLSACGSSGQVNPSSGPVTVRFAYDYWPGYYPALIANQKKFYEDENIKLQAIKPENTDALMADFLAGKYDAIAVSLGDVIVLTQSNDDFVVVMSSDESAGGDAVLVNPSIKSIAELKGKKIGTNIGGFGEVFITTVLKSNNIQPSEVTFVNMDASEGPSKLKQNELDAVHTWEPYVSEAKGNGAKVLFSSADTPGLIIDVIVFRGAFAREHPEAVKGFVNGWFKAVDYWLLNNDDGNAAAAKELNINPSEISLEGIKLQTLENNKVLFTPGNTSESLYYTTGVFTDFFINKGSLREAPDINKLLTSQYLP